MLGTIPLSNQTDVFKVHNLKDSFLWSMTYSLITEKSVSRCSSSTSSHVQIHRASTSNNFDSGFFSQKASMIMDMSSTSSKSELQGAP